MLAATLSPRHALKPGTRQSGVVLIITLIVLVAMTLAAIAMVRSVDTSNLVAGNLAFQQSAVHSSDSGVEAAIAWLNDCNNTHATCALGTLESDQPSNGYSAAGGLRGPAAGQSWDAYWLATLNSTNTVTSNTQVITTGNTVSYVIDRMCNAAGAIQGGASCLSSPSVLVQCGNQESIGGNLACSSVVYYRITARVSGPRNSVSYIQAMVSMGS